MRQLASSDEAFDYLEQCVRGEYGPAIFLAAHKCVTERGYGKAPNVLAERIDNGQSSLIIRTLERMTAEELAQAALRVRPVAARPVRRLRPCPRLPPRQPQPFGHLDPPVATSPRPTPPSEPHPRLARRPLAARLAHPSLRVPAHSPSYHVSRFHSALESPIPCGPPARASRLPQLFH